MNFINLIIENKITEASDFLFDQLNKIASVKLQQEKVNIVNGLFVQEETEPAIIIEKNVVRQGRTKIIRRRIRRVGGKIVVQKNIRKSAVKGYTLRAGKLRRITAQQKMRMRLAQRRAAIKRRAKMRQSLRKRMMSLRRRKTLGIR